MKDIKITLIEIVRSLQKRRYPTLLIVQDDSFPISVEISQAIAKACSLQHVNYRDDVLTQDQSPIVLGVYLRGQFREWLKAKAREDGGLFVVNADELISSWNDSERKAFFVDFLHIESNTSNHPTSRAPIVLLSRHAKILSMPTLSCGQGIVFDPSTMGWEGD